MNTPRLIFASAVAAIATIVFVVVITIWAELSVPLKDWLKNFSGHHWTSKSIFSALLYAGVTVIVYGLFHNPGEVRLRRTLVFLLASTTLGSIILTAFFTAHHFRLF